MTEQETREIAAGFMVRENLTANERTRLRECESAFEVALRQRYGSRLATIMVDKLVSELARDGRVSHYVITGQPTEVDPALRDSWLPIAEEKVEADSLARRNIDFSDQALRHELTAEFIRDHLKPTDRLNYERDGTLQGRIDAFIEAEIDRRSGLL